LLQFSARSSPQKNFKSVRHPGQQKNWLDFAQHGLAPSELTPPSAPVLRLLFALLKKEAGIDSSSKYLDMLKAMACLEITGSYAGAVYQEQVTYACLVGQSISCVPVSLADGAWQFGSPGLLIQHPALLVQYRKDGLTDPLYFGPELSAIPEAKLKASPPVLCYVAENQCFPSIDLTLACIDHEEKSAVLYHCSVSVSTRHFAPTLGSKGHLPLDLSISNPMLRSQKAKNQVAEYKKSVLTHLKTWGIHNVCHHYAVFDDIATDLLQPTFPFEKSYFKLSTAMA